MDINWDHALHDAKRMIRVGSKVLRATSWEAYLHYASMRKIYTTQIPTMATDGRRLLINPIFAAYMCEGTPNYDIGEKIKHRITSSASCVAAVLYHEVEHRVRKHHLRMDDRDPEVWNIATDRQINATMKADVARLQLPAPHVFESIEDARKSAEEIYRSIQQEQSERERGEPEQGEQEQGEQEQGEQEQGEQGGEGDFASGAHADPSSVHSAILDRRIGEVLPFDGDDVERVEEEIEIEEIHAQAKKDHQAEHEKDHPDQTSGGKGLGGHSVGTGTDPLCARIEQARESQISYLDEMEDLVAHREVVDLNPARPRKKFWIGGTYIPDFKWANGATSLLVISDESGSIDMAAHAKFAADIKRLCEQVQPDYVTVAHVADRVGALDHFDSADDVELTRKVSGGTYLDSALLRTEEICEIPPDAIVVFTDLCVSSQDLAQAPKAPVLFVSWMKGKQAPYGKTVYINQ